MKLAKETSHKTIYKQKLFKVVGQLSKKPPHKRKNIL